MSDLIVVIPSILLMFLIVQFWLNFALKSYVRRCKKEYKDKTKPSI